MEVAPRERERITESGRAHSKEGEREGATKTDWEAEREREQWTKEGGNRFGEESKAPDRNILHHGRFH